MLSTKTRCVIVFWPDVQLFSGCVSVFWPVVRLCSSVTFYLFLSCVCIRRSVTFGVVTGTHKVEDDVYDEQQVDLCVRVYVCVGGCGCVCARAH